MDSRVAPLHPLQFLTYRKKISDVAISAPYEQGTGAIYIYLGNPEGITEKYSQRILPEDFKDSISGFGISISRGVDVDGNSYNGVGF